jgi:choline kinase
MCRRWRPTGKRSRPPEGDRVSLARVIIPAAGLGSRLGTHTSRAPKSLFQVGREAIIERALRQFAHAGVPHVVVITGHCARQLADAVSSYTERPDVTFVNNPAYSTTNSLVSLGLTRQWWDEEFCVVDGDVLFDDATLAELLSAPPDTLLIDTSRKYEEIDVKVAVDPDGFITNLSKELGVSETVGEFFGLSRWSPSGATALGHVMDEMIEAHETSAWYEDAIVRLAKRQQLAALPLSAACWAEIDAAVDIPRAELVVAKGAS